MVVDDKIRNMMGSYEQVKVNASSNNSYKRVRMKKKIKKKSIIFDDIVVD